MEEGSKKKGYAFAILAGLSAAFAAISAKFFSFQVIPSSFDISTLWSIFFLLNDPVPVRQVLIFTMTAIF